MKLCNQCRRTPWPFMIALFIATFAAFLTWLTTTFSNLDFNLRVAASAGVFVAVAATISHYVLSCMRRHCQQDHQHHHVHDDSRENMVRS